MRKPFLPHDYNAKDDPKIVLMTEQLGPVGYGIYWMVIETLLGQPDYKYPLKLVPALARRFNTTVENVAAVINDFDLFQVDDGECFSSHGLYKRMESYDKMVEAGRRGGQISAALRKGTSTPGEPSLDPPLNPPSTNISNNNKDNITQLNTTNSNNTDPSLAQYLKTLQAIKNYPYDPAKDSEYYATLAERFPTVDLVLMIQDYQSYKLDHPIQPKDNPRSQINTQCKNCIAWNKNLKSQSRGPIQTSADIPEYFLKANGYR